ncbi:hypothetical protein Mgra_00003439, partial [Meloidogyne graminicola]
SGVDELLEDPSQLTEAQNIIGESKGPIEELNTVVISVMSLFTSTHLDGPIQIRDRDIIAMLNQTPNSVKEQYERYLTELGKLKAKFNLIHSHEQQTHVELTLNPQQNNTELEIHQLLKKNNIYMQNIIILAMNIIKSLINLYNLTIPPQQINIFYHELVKCLNEFKIKTFLYVNNSSSTRNLYMRGNINTQKINEVNGLCNKIMKEYEFIPKQFQVGHGRGNVHSHGQGSGGV